MEFTIRKAQLTDFTDLQALMEQLTGHSIKDRKMADRFRMIDTSAIGDLYVLERDRKIQGVLGFRIRENLEEASRYGEISVVVTLSESRRKGLGTHLCSLQKNLPKKEVANAHG
jgi:N-acetylglutamate synthase-like GNAT family acetyltransferase